MKNRIIAITGGIGAGKSVVSRMLVALGYTVYDCDSRAKVLMDSSDEIKSRIGAEIAPEVVADGIIRRDMLAAIVFSDPEKLLKLNNIVHHHVRRDIALESSRVPLLFIETAILYESGLDGMVESVWEVTAPETVRVGRIVSRNSCSEAEARARIESQRRTPARLHPSIHKIINDGVEPVLPRVLELLKTV
ncbi:MAG: dephospho-CoA kinase [Muribaculaceae bacterium]|nr:dephospho-CoA kinase [Muribaculaceae bacterium]